MKSSRAGKTVRAPNRSVSAPIGTRSTEPSSTEMATSNETSVSLSRRLRCSVGASGPNSAQT